MQILFALWWSGESMRKICCLCKWKLTFQNYFCFCRYYEKFDLCGFIQNMNHRNRWLQFFKLTKHMQEGFTCRPQHPTAFNIEALCTTRYWIPAFTARKTRSLCVVALQENGERSGINAQIDTGPQIPHIIPDLIKFWQKSNKAFYLKVNYFHSKLHHNLPSFIWSS